MPFSEHQLLIFWLQLFVLLVVARALGGLMRRIGQPAVIGELAGGLLVGPSILGMIAPGVQTWLFPDDPTQQAALMAVAWLGVALLLVITGFETDLKLLTALGRPAILVSTGSLLAPLALGFALGLALPDALMGDPTARLPFAMFMAVALSISALPVIAKILLDLDLMRRNIGQITVAAGMANDLIGWILLGAVAGLVTSGRIDFTSLVTTFGGLALFLVLALTLGQRLADAALRRAREAGLSTSFTVLVLTALGAGAITQALGVEAVLGAFIAGIVLGRSRYQREEVRRILDVSVSSVLAPLFFATAGLAVDLRTLFDPGVALWATVVIIIAAIAKLGGTYIGARLGRLAAIEGLAIGIGLNARGALEIIVATIGLSLGVLNTTSFTVVVVMAMVTSMMAPPLLRRVLRRVVAGPTETARLQREAVLQQSVIAGATNALLPTRGGVNSLFAGRLLDLSLQADTGVTILTVSGQGSAERGRSVADELRGILGSRRVEHIDRSEDDPAHAILKEARLGYGLVALGVTEDFGERPLSPILRQVLSRCAVPMLLVKHGRGLSGLRSELPLQRLLVPAAGTRVSQAAQEVAFTVAVRSGAHVDVVHVLTRPSEVPPRGLARLSRRAAPRETPPRTSAASTVILERAQELGRQFGADVNVLTRTGSAAGPELVAAAQERGANLIVISGQVRSHVGEPFLGHGVEWLLEHAPQTVLAILFPDTA